MMGGSRTRVGSLLDLLPSMFHISCAASLSTDHCVSSSPELEPTTYHNPYTPESIQDSVPPCPLPYDTYDGPNWMNVDQAELWKM